nr:hypothetical protein [Mesorhizobium sp.]
MKRSPFFEEQIIGILERGGVAECENSPHKGGLFSDLVAGARNTRFLRLVERQISRLAA